MDVALWVVQILLAVAFAGAGFTHATRRDQATDRMAWMLAVPKPLLTTIGVLEITGAVALVLPWLTGTATWLTPLAAIAFVVLMVLAAIFHLRRPGEAQNAVFNVVLGALALFVAWGRFDALPV
jgi:uncharacterized membrane protein YphA (DoxX/SURF4 family)